LKFINDYNIFENIMILIRVPEKLNIIFKRAKDIMNCPDDLFRDFFLSLQNG
jgi:hypothetical protein